MTHFRASPVKLNSFKESPPVVIIHSLSAPSGARKTAAPRVSLTRSLAVEYGPQRVRVNCICPAGVETEMVKASSLDDPDFDAEFFFSRAPLGRLGTPEEIANLAVFLASDESSYLNGAIIRADGGITIAPIS